MDSSRRKNGNTGIKLVMIVLGFITAGSMHVAMTHTFTTETVPDPLPWRVRTHGSSNGNQQTNSELLQEGEIQSSPLALNLKQELDTMKNELKLTKEELAKAKSEMGVEAKVNGNQDKDAELAKVKEELEKVKEAEKLDKEENRRYTEERKNLLAQVEKAKEAERELARVNKELQLARTKLRTAQTGKKPMNILLLYGDDWRHDSLGSASGGFVKTPFLDNLAKEGIRFTHNCVTTSVCWISRATLYSGQYVSRHKSTDPMKPEFYNQWKTTFPHLLKQEGYYFGHVGKWHFANYETYVKPKFDFERMYYGRHWFDEREGRIHTTKKNEKDAIEFLQTRPKDQPFFLSVCFFTPHAEDGNPEQYLPQNESMALYADETVPIAPSATEEAWQKMPKFFKDSGINEGRNRWKWRFDTPERYQHMMKNYYRLISEIDSSSGAIVEELKKQGVLDDTLVIFTTDNGYYHAEHGLADKWFPHQESIRVPLIIRDPRMPKDRIGQVNDEFTLSIDLAPTILGAAGIETPEVMHGRDMAALYAETKDMSPWRKEFFYEHPVHLKKEMIPASEALVRKDFKYMYWPDYDVEQFFDLKNDGYELNDLINKTAHNDLITEMRSRFKELKELAK